MQSIHRKIINLGFGTTYVQDATIREQCKQLMALSLMPLDEVEQQFKRIREISSTALDDLFMYFERQWMNGNVPLSMWNSYDADHRTNNISEGNKNRYDSGKFSLTFFLFNHSIQSSFHNTHSKETPKHMDFYTVNSE